MKNKSNNNEKISVFVKVFFSVLTVFMIIVLLVGEKLLPENVGKYKYIRELDGNWTREYSDGSRENIGSITGRRIFESEEGKPLVLEYTLDADIPIGSFLSVRSSSQAIYVYIDNVLRVEYDNAKIRKWGSSNVSRYLFVPLNSDDGEKTVRIEYTGVGMFAGMTSIVYMGTLDSLWYELIQNDGFSMLLETMLAIIGLVMLIMCAIIYFRK